MTQVLMEPELGLRSQNPALTWTILPSGAKDHLSRACTSKGELHGPGLLLTCQLHQEVQAAVGTLSKPTNMTGVRCLQRTISYLQKILSWWFTAGFVIIFACQPSRLPFKSSMDLTAVVAIAAKIQAELVRNAGLLASCVICICLL